MGKGERVCGMGDGLEEEADMKRMTRGELTKALSKTIQEGIVDGRAANSYGRTLPLPISTKHH